MHPHTPTAWITCLALLGSAGVAFSNEKNAPGVGILYSQAEAASLTYDCEPARDQNVTCQITRREIKPKAKPEDLEQILAKAKARFPTEKPMPATECKDLALGIEILEGKSSQAPNPEWKALPESRKVVTLKSLKTLHAACKQHNLENYLAVAKAQHEVNQGICVIRSHTYERKFKRLPTSDGSNVWSSQEAPEGSCGIFDIEVFEVGKELTTAKHKLWNFSIKRVMSNPKSEFVTGVPCSDFAQADQRFSWASKEYPLSCTTVEFSAF